MNTTFSRTILNTFWTSLRILVVGRHRWPLPRLICPNSSLHSSIKCRISGCSLSWWPSFSCRGRCAVTLVATLMVPKTLPRLWVYKLVCWCCACLGVSCAKINKNWYILEDCSRFKIWLSWVKLVLQWFSSWVFHSTTMLLLIRNNLNSTMLLIWHCGPNRYHSDSPP